jgi:hypothetical protein
MGYHFLAASCSATYHCHLTHSLAAPAIIEFKTLSAKHSFQIPSEFSVGRGQLLVKAKAQPSIMIMFRVLEGVI